jgi:sporulation protein YlmC with PRC-barrel domain
MSDSSELIFGAETFCSDGPCGEITGVVLDPVTRVVSHAVVEPKHRQGLGRLTPLPLIDFSTPELILRCTSAEFEALDHAEETVLLPGTGGRAAYVAGQPLDQPYSGLEHVIGNVPQPVTYDIVPRGELEVRRGERIEEGDGEVGTIRGLVIDHGSGQVTRILVHEHHLWRHRDASLPVEEVEAIINENHLMP